MAVYAVSLRRLAKQRRQRHDAKRAADLPATATSRGEAAAAGPASVAGKSAGGDQPGVAKHEPSLSAHELLQLPREQLEKLLARSDREVGKVVLALLWRLGVLERKVADLGGRLQRSAVGPSLPAAPVTFLPPTKSGLLEQVFLKNRSLRQRDGDG